MAIYPSYFLSSYSFFLPRFFYFLFFFFLFLVFLAFFFRVLCNLFPVQTDHHLASLSSSDHHHHLFSFFISSSCYHHHQRSSSSSRCCYCQCRWRCSSCFCWVLWQFTLLSPFPPAAIAVQGEFSFSSPWRRSSFSLTVFPVAVIFILLLPVIFRWTQAREGDVFGAVTTCAVFILQFSSSCLQPTASITSSTSSSPSADQSSSSREAAPFCSGQGRERGHRKPLIPVIRVVSRSQVEAGSLSFINS